MKISFLLAVFFCAGAAQAADLRAPTFKTVEIDAKIEIGYGVAVADVNGDKKPDILLADKSQFVWYENPSWAKHVIAEKLTVQDHVCLAAQDIDGDGKCELAVGAGWNPGDTLNSGAVFYLKPGDDRTKPWEAIKLPHEPTVHRMRWVRNGDGGHDLVMVPLHGRGNKPATGEGAGVRVLRYQRPDDPKDAWKVDALDDSLHKTHNFDPVSWDSDAAQEMLVAGKEGIFLLDVSGPKPSMTQLAGGEGGGAGEVRLGKLSGNKRFITAVEPMHGNTLVVYTPAAKAGALWSRLVVDESLVDGHALACGDFAGIGRDQIVVGWRAMNRPGAKVGIKLLTPLDEAGAKWQSVIVDDNGMACEDLCLADLNGDGRLDIIAAGRATKNVRIYLNLGKK